jgi:hypothetical protein
MNFLDSIKRQEEEKHRISAWSRAITELSRFIRRHLRQAEAQSPLTVRPDLIRLDGIFFVRLTVLFGGRTVTMTPISLADARTPYRGGCVAVRSTNGMRCDLLWNGFASAAPDNWTITAAHDGSDVSGNAAAQSLSEASLDEALNWLFELSGRIEQRGVGDTRLTRSAAPIAFATTSNLYSGAMTANGTAPNLLDAKEINSFAPSYRKP